MTTQRARQVRESLLTAAAELIADRGWTGRPPLFGLGRQLRLGAEFPCCGEVLLHIADPDSPNRCSGGVCGS